jgi:hypothetical protein
VLSRVTAIEDQQWVTTKIRYALQGKDAVVKSVLMVVDSIGHGQFVCGTKIESFVYNDSFTIKSAITIYLAPRCSLAEKKQRMVNFQTPLIKIVSFFFTLSGLSFPS